VKSGKEEIGDSFMGSAVAGLWKTPEGRAGHTPEFPAGDSSFLVAGELFHISPLNLNEWDINFTSFPGKCSGVIYSLLFWLGKWGYKNVKVDDTLEVSPMDQKYYQITISQKQALERQIKEGLTGISSSISDFELLFHDLRKYKDYMQYFEDREKAKNEKDKEKKEKLLEKSEQSLKAIFIDFVDVHTGEGVALKLIAQRWPTIIADFMRLKERDTEPKKIAKEYKVSEAEGVVLSTKNKLYVEWRNSFEKTVKMRYQRILDMTKARKFSIDEYKRMLKPYIQRFKSINEVGPSTPSTWVRPGAQAASFDTTTIWSFKELTPAEHGKPSFERESGTEHILKVPYPSSFKKVIKDNMDYLKKNNEHGEDYTAVPIPPTRIEPLDKWAWALYKYIEDYYTKKIGLTVRFTLADLFKYRNEFISGWGNHAEPYYKCAELNMTRIVIRLPDGTELEDLTFNPMYFFLDSYNVMFLRYLEIMAQEKAMGLYIDEMLGDTTKGKNIGELSKEFEKLFGSFGSASEASDKEKKDIKVHGMQLRKYRDSERVQKQIMREVTEMKRPFKILKKGPYEPEFDDRITGPWFTDMAVGFAVPVMTVLKTKFGVPGFTMPGIK
jgi:DNA-binding PadR family transcriptional regulator